MSRNSRVLIANSAADGSVELYENEYFKDSTGLVARFRGERTTQQNQDDEILVQPTTVPEEGDGVGGPNEDLQDQVGQGNRNRPRPDFVIHIHGSPYQTLGRIGVVGRGITQEKYLELKCKK
jgi:hypothetical protein